jgi:AraC family transcriptional regulator
MPGSTEFHAITRGEELVAYQLDGFRLVETHHSARTQLPRHAHDEASINFVFRGSLSESVGALAGRSPFQCDPGTMLYKPPAEYHANSYENAGARCLIVQPSAERLVELADAGVKVHAVTFSGDPRFAHLMGRIYSEIKAPVEGLTELAVEGYVETIFSLMARADLRREKPAWVRTASEFLSAHSRERLSLRAVARAVGVHPTDFSRAFRRVYGITPSDFVRKERTKWAAAQLADRERALTDISLSAGFADQSHFTRTFQAHYGVTPSRFRKLFGRH